MSASIPIVVRPTSCCETSCSETVTSEVPGPAGPAGADGTNGTNGSNAFTTTTAQFTQPAVGADVTVAVTISSWASLTQVVYVSNGGYYTVQGKPDSTHLTLRNLGYTGNAAPTTIIATSQTVSPGGLVGPAGSAGAGTLNAISPTTTKGDLIGDNGANSPSASNVRVPVGSNGKAVVADSTQAAGINYATITPNAGTDNGVPRFDGATGTPIPLQTSKVIITDNGAVQASGSGGNARGADAIDLQVSRTLGVMVASGDNSVIAGGVNNKATGDFSTVSGGDGNTAGADGATVAGGSSNAANGSDSTVIGGLLNTANGNQSCIAGGASGTAGGGGSFIGGGSSNTVSGDLSAIIGGQDNTASASFSVAFGNSAKADKYGQHAQASGKFAVAGDAETSVLTLFGSTTNATPTEIFLDGSGTRITIPSDTTWAFRMLIVARRTDADDESAAYQLLGCIDRNGAVGTTALVGTVSKTVIAEDTAAWDVAATADAVNGALVLTVTGEAAKVVKWVCRTELVQMTG